MSWNVCGWNDNNAKCREAVVLGMNCDIIVLQETHLNKDGLIKIPGYVSDKKFFHNRKETNIRAKKNYGGVAFLFKHEMFLYFDIQVVDKSVDGIIAIKLVNNVTDYSIIVVGCYLRPEQSVWGRNAVGFFADLLELIYMYPDIDAMYICGDLNSRIGSKQDYISVIDDVRERKVIDFTVNSHGGTFQEFLIDARYCIVNGRIDADNDNFTFVHSRG